LITIAIVAVIAAVYWLSDLVLLLFGAVMFAIVLRAIADPIISHLHAPAPVALLVAFTAVIGVPIATMAVFGPELARQVTTLLQQLPVAFAKIVDDFQLGQLMLSMTDGASMSGIGNLVARVFAWSTTFLNVLASIALVLSGGVYLAADPSLYRAGALTLVSPSFRASLADTLDDSADALRRWLRAQLLAMALVGTLTAIGLSLVGVPSAIALGVLTGLANFVPIIGPIAAAVPTLLMASTTDWQTTVAALGVLVVVQQIENNLIVPLVTGRSVSLPPAIGLFAVIAMGLLFGPLGVLYGFPLSIVTTIAIQRLYLRDVLGVSLGEDRQSTTPAAT
jgi:predicted PurR-regulated permease PerM